MAANWRDDGGGLDRSVEPWLCYIAAALDLSRRTALWRTGRLRAVAGVALLAAVGLLSSMGAPAAHSAQADDGWIGKRVVQKYGSFRLKIESRLIDPKGFVIYSVERVNGPWLWLTVDGQGLSGWALADQVVAVDDAIAFFTDYIRANPDEPAGYTRRALVSHLVTHELDNALGDSNEAIRLDPTKASGYCNRGNVWYDKEGLRKRDRGL